ncbi:MAG: hypothetical protein HZC42_08200 [Candidatus Eisenbacteria bacterium]|nr:hypothetical protein [Candidatus Eisenbacteria bacterium]
MRTRDACARAVLAGLAVVAALTALVLGGCATGRPQPPRGWLPSGAQGTRHYEDGYGAWARLVHGSRRNWSVAEGELIAATAESLYVLEPGGLAAVPTRRNRSAAFGISAVDPTWRSHPAAFTISEGDHGTEITRVGARDWVAMRRYARFPQGPPAGVDLRALMPKPVP